MRTVSRERARNDRASIPIITNVFKNAGCRKTATEEIATGYLREYTTMINRQLTVDKISLVIACFYPPILYVIVETLRNEDFSAGAFMVGMFVAGIPAFLFSFIVGFLILIFLDKNKWLTVYSVG